jgi:hypothetical protein
VSFLKSYTDYAGRLTDAPPLFHTWVGIGLLATALGNQCWAWEWGRRLCPNVWIVLLADSGVLRKTTALGIGQGVLMESLPYLVWPSEWSFEALIQTLAQKPDGVLIVREFKRFNAALMRDYAGGSKELLVDAYDNPELDSRRTKQDGNTEMRVPAPNLLAATTRDWFEASLQKEDVGGGFLSRMVIVPATERGEWKGIGATRSDADRLQKEDLARYLETARHTMQGEIDASQIEGPFNEWLRQYEDSWAYCLNSEMTGTISRSGANALKLTMIFQADREPSTTLTLDAFERARQMVELANKQMADLLADGLGLSPDAKERKRVAAVIRRAHPNEIQRSVLLNATNASADALDRHVKTLVEAQQITIREHKQATGRPAKAYRWIDGTKP